MLGLAGIEVALYSAVTCFFVAKTLVFWLLLKSVKAFSLLLTSRLRMHKKPGGGTVRTADLRDIRDHMTLCSPLKV